jgi:predicted hydrocarbon binding protein
MSELKIAHSELLELDSEGGYIRFAGQRALLIDATAMGLLRRYLVDNFGLIATRTVLTQFGFAHGWRMAEALRAEYDEKESSDWLRIGLRIHALEGLYRVELGSDGRLLDEGVTIAASYEAEQHLVHFGRSDVPICWTVCGVLSGYASQVTGSEIFVLEDRCIGKGDAACHLIGRTREGWGEERAEELNFFEKGRLQESLDVSLRRVIDTLKDLVRTGDTVLRIEGSFSGTLGYLTNELMSGVPLATAVRVARDLGYTEPHPADDLSGLDVARKALILARELGMSLELDDIVVEPLVPHAVLEATNIEDFFAALTAWEPVMEELLAEYRADGRTLRYLARIEPGEDGAFRVAVGPVGIPSSHPAVRLRGAESFVAFTTERFNDHPLIVQGAGAGGAVTAAGVLADVLSIPYSFQPR